MTMKLISSLFFCFVFFPLLSFFVFVLRQVYSQLEAEDSNNDLLSTAYGIINSKLDGVTSMSLDYGGQG